MSKGQSFLAELESMQEDVARELFEDEQEIYRVLAPDGVPFGMQDNVLSDNDKIIQYVTQFRGNPQAQQIWIRNRVNASISQLDAAGISLDMAATEDTRVYEAAMEAAIYYSYRMEGLLKTFKRREGIPDES